MKKSDNITFTFGENGSLENMTEEGHFRHFKDRQMPKQQLNLRVSDLTTHQLKQLMEWWGTSKTETITLIIDRAYKEEAQNRNPKDESKLDTEPTIFKFHYYPTKGYTCSQPGDNTGYYVNLNEYERLRNKGTDNERR